MKFLIAGFGSIGRRHLRNLRTLGESDIILLRSHKSTLPDDEITGLPVETDIIAALAHKPDAVIISNPTALHLDVAIPAAKAGCAILMEKPVSHSLDRLDEFKQAVKTGGAGVLMGYQFRFHPGLLQVKTWLADGLIGRPLSFRAQWGEYLPNWHPWEDYRASYTARQDLGGGVVVTLSHPIDYLRWLLGDVKSLWAFSGRLSDLEIQVEDYAEIGMQFANGVTGSLHVDYYQQPPSHTLEITGTAGRITWDNADGTARLFQAETGKWQEVNLPANFDRNDLFIAETKHFLDIVQKKAEPVCSLADGEAALKLCLAVHESAANGQLVHL
ncbi:3-chlorobenzoate-3,4-dioxygenase dehydrogenase [Leptolinea sp. HRD-7]|nr:3-chlorobenzoate-3,4-dioxygenase dehydrogenase [Leptolinea sp. HRD-7]